MKKIISFLLILAILTLCLAGCSGNGQDGEVGSQSASQSSRTESGTEGSKVSQGEAPSSSSAGSKEPASHVESGVSDPEGASDTELVLYAWEAMFPQEVLDSFTEETGIQVEYVNFDYDETMLAQLQAAKGGKYDVVLGSDYILETVIEEGLAQKLDVSRLENYSCVNPLYQGQFFDPDDEYTVPYAAGVQTLVYDPSLVEKEISGYEDLWDSSLKDKVGIVANSRVVDGMALKTLGESFNTEDVSALDRAGEKLLELAPNIHLIRDGSLQDSLLSGEIAAAVLYTPQSTAARIADPKLKTVFPEEGICFGLQSLFIPAGALHESAAYKFLDYILRPEISAQCCEYLGYFCTNREADSLISEKYREFLTLPEDVSKEDLELIQGVSSQAQEKHSEIWKAFRGACG